MEETTEKKTKKAELKTTDLKVEGKKVKVMFLKGSVHEGEIREIDKPLADECDNREYLDLIKLFLVKSEKLKIKSFILFDFS